MDESNAQRTIFQCGHVEYDHTQPPTQRFVRPNSSPGTCGRCRSGTDFTPGKSPPSQVTNVEAVATATLASHSSATQKLRAVQQADAAQTPPRQSQPQFSPLARSTPESSQEEIEPTISGSPVGLRNAIRAFWGDRPGPQVSKVEKDESKDIDQEQADRSSPRRVQFADNLEAPTRSGSPRIPQQDVDNTFIPSVPQGIRDRLAARALLSSTSQLRHDDSRPSLPPIMEEAPGFDETPDGPVANRLEQAKYSGDLEDAPGPPVQQPSPQLYSLDSLEGQAAIQRIRQFLGFPNATPVEILAIRQLPDAVLDHPGYQTFLRDLVSIRWSRADKALAEYLQTIKLALNSFDGRQARQRILTALRLPDLATTKDMFLALEGEIPEALLRPGVFTKLSEDFGALMWNTKPKQRQPPPRNHEYMTPADNPDTLVDPDSPEGLKMLKFIRHFMSLPPTASRRDILAHRTAKLKRAMRFASVDLNLKEPLGDLALDEDAKTRRRTFDKYLRAIRWKMEDVEGLQMRSLQRRAPLPDDIAGGFDVVEGPVLESEKTLIVTPVNARAKNVVGLTIVDGRIMVIIKRPLSGLRNEILVGATWFDWNSEQGDEENHDDDFEGLENFLLLEDFEALEDE